jgi:hypothetical protein
MVELMVCPPATVACTQTSKEESVMKALLCVVACILAILISFSCRKDAPTPTEVVNPHVRPVPSTETGVVIVYFVDSVSIERAEQFIEGLHLSIIDFSRYDLRSPHEGSVRVPVGEELMWRDSLRTYPIVFNANVVSVISQE